MPSDDRNASHRVGAPQQPLAGPAVLGRLAQGAGDQRYRFGELLVPVTGEHLAGTDKHGRVRVDLHGSR